MRVLATTHKVDNDTIPTCIIHVREMKYTEIELKEPECDPRQSLCF